MMLYGRNTNIAIKWYRKWDRKKFNAKGGISGLKK